MLFGYPVEATQENWLHDCLCEIVLSVHDRIDNGKKLPIWPGIAPVAHRDQLKRRTGLKVRVAAYFEAASTLSIVERASIATVMADQNKIPDLLSCMCDCLTIDDIPDVVRNPVRSLFGFGFGLLSDFGTRDRQYELIYVGIKSQVCPFCGCEYFDSPKGKREALDHYLDEARYPFAASNLRNLAPMGNKCNSRYKLTADILHGEGGIRRRAFDPYHAAVLQVSLDESLINQHVDGHLVADWIVKFSIETEETETWDEVFSIRDRYKRDFLEARSFNELLWDFRNWCVAAAPHIAGDNDVLDAMVRYEQYHSLCGFSDRSFLKAAVFRLLLARCKDGCERVWGVMRDLVNNPQPA